MEPVSTSSSYAYSLHSDFHTSSVSSSLFSVASPWPWMISLTRSSVLAVLKHAINRGSLHIEDAAGTYQYGCPSKLGHIVYLKVLNDNFWLRVFISGGLGFSEAYMMGEIVVDNLNGIIQLFIDNMSGLSGISSSFSRVTSALSGVSNAFLGQTRSRARLNVIASYDQSNELFKAFLSKEMMYSCALWGHEEGGVRGDVESESRVDDLEAAQLRKLHHVLRKARVKPGHRILEFGTGWGALAIEAARTYGCEIDTLTLSVEQKTLAEERVREAGLQDRVRVHLLDYRDIPADFKQAFDAFISIEMLEHVGAKVRSLARPRFGSDFAIDRSTPSIHDSTIIHTLSLSILPLSHGTLRWLSPPLRSLRGVIVTTSALSLTIALVCDSCRRLSSGQIGRLHAAIHVAQLVFTKCHSTDQCCVHCITGSIHPRRRRKSRST
ncbi:hypothetical protein AcV5_001814 [Taiwanofungus camphoratus]|nr:hypothetical protein AcV5_001814 [Antrodia cinnamomea]